MPNYRIIDPVKANITTSKDLSSLNGKIFMLTTGLIQLDGRGNGNNNKLAIIVSNTSNSNQYVNIGTICGSSIFRTTFELYRNGSFPSGTDIIPHNTNTKFNDTPTIISSKYIKTSSNPFSSDILLSSFIQEQGMNIYYCDGTIKIYAGDSIGFLITNYSTQSAYVTLNISLIES
ncbi:MAG: hypothetical protein N4A64_03425 [Marinisporobacter sp.]|jgi:hypothetical protein|nr:hypothetical protein [Marinisporobacter sp.]